MNIFLRQSRHVGNKLRVVLDENSATPIYMNCSEGKYFKHIDDMFYNMYYPREEERGFTSTENHYVPGVYSINIPANEEKDITFVCSLEENIRTSIPLIVICLAESYCLPISP